MKRLIVSISILCLSVILCLFSYNYLENKTKQLDSYLSDCYSLIEKEKLEQAESKLRTSSAFWEENKRNFNILIDGSFCETVENNLDALSFCFAEKEYTEAKSIINECRNTLKQIMEGEKLSSETVL